MSSNSESRRRHTMRATAASIIATAVAFTVITGTPASAKPDDAPSWQQYVLGPSSPQVHPADVTARGNVTNPKSLVKSGKTTTLTTVAGETPASVLLDFGKDVAGTPYLDIANLQGSPSLSLVTSESLAAIRTPASTTVKTDAAQGASTVTLASTARLESGNTITFGTGASAQKRTIDTFDATAGTVTFRPALTAAVTASTAVSSTPGAPTADDSGGLSGFGGTATLTPTKTGRITGPFRGGFRFALITLTSPGSVTLSSAGVDFQAYRATPADYQGWFESSSTELNKMWYSGAYTVQLDMAHDGLNGLPGDRILDGAKRDRSVWTGDLLVEGPEAMSTLGPNGASYLRSSLDLLLASQRADGALPGAPDFGARKTPLFYSNNYSGFGVRAAIDYYRYAGDAAWARSNLAALEHELEYNAQFVDASGLVASNDRDYWQTSQQGEVTKYSIDYYVLLREMAWLEVQIGSPALATQYNGQADALKSAINAHLWSPTLGAYMQSSAKPAVMVEDANALALQYGIVPADKVASVQAALKTLWTAHGAQIGTGLVDPYGHTIEPYGNGLETAGRFASGDTAGALDLMNRTWGQMIDPQNPLYTGAFWEFLTADGTVTRAQDSLAHGWSAAPTVQLTEQVLGITPVGPGYSTWSVKPHPGDLTWSKGQVPTTQGTLAVDWTAFKSEFTIHVASPKKTSGTISVPATRTSTVSLNGKVVWKKGLSTGANATLSTDGYITINAGAGNSDITVKNN
ncbi:alpha-L-rhamnosidase C-terminal domain-containing protein [Streptomyces sp. NPDC005078]|uniref:alpha-L-rhamnosidase-related protein n=1 Tax=Streptomyces sp. NPDC005078 TaxID=3154293 RepID=UPI0033B2F0B3